MSYVSNSDIEQRLGSDAYVQLTDDDGDGVADVAVVNEAKLGAEGEVDSYLARRFQVPIALGTHPELAGVIASITLDLVEYRLRARRPPVPVTAIRARDEAIEWLRRVASAEIHLPSASPPSPNMAQGLTAETSGSERVLSREGLSEH